jgi:hypothetical protein
MQWQNQEGPGGGMRKPKESGVLYAIWPGDPEAIGPYMSHGGRMDVFLTEDQAQRFLTRYILDPQATIRPMRLVEER